MRSQLVNADGNFPCFMERTRILHSNDAALKGSDEYLQVSKQRVLTGWRRGKIFRLPCNKNTVSNDQTVNCFYLSRVGTDKASARQVHILRGSNVPH